jgi:ribonucleoside-diphosphate reductase beta chain
MLLDKRVLYKPFKYPWAFEAYRTQQLVHWMPTEVSLNQDVVNWNQDLSNGQKEFLTQLFRFFTQADVSVAEGYATKFLPKFAGNPEICMMLTTFAAMEAVHVDAYSILVDTIGFPETEYSVFLDYAAMRDKYEYLQTINMDTEMDIAKSLAVYSAFTEGVQLFSSFAMLMHFGRIGKMPAMNNIVAWSLRDENCHSDNMIKLFRAFVHEYITQEDFESLSSQIRGIAEKMVELEDKFIDLAFSTVSEEELNVGLRPGQKPLTKHDLKLYTRHLTDYRLNQLGMQPVYGNPNNPLPWINELTLAPEHANFFEVRSTEYTKGAIKGEVTNW